ncbi:MAG: SET domain-containing protein-lysine N-methyltransferase [Chlamydiia bacterium]
MGQGSHTYDQEVLKKEPFFEIDRCYARSLRNLYELKKATRKHMRKWELENHLIKKYAKYLGKKSPVDLQVRWISPTMGNGVFVNEPVKKGAFLCEYTGLITHEDKIDPDNRYVFNLMVGDDETGFVIDARHSGNVARTINHSDKPNVEAVTIFIDGQPRVVYTAFRDIKKGEELLVDYGEDYWHKWTKESTDASKSKKK